MLVFPDIDPVALRLGPLAVRWYGLMYLIGFALFWWLGRRRAGRPRAGWRAEEVDDLLFYGALGVIIGGRLGYVLFYDLPHTLANPVSLFQVWRGGMSFHGGLLGVIVAMGWFARTTGRTFFQVADFVAPMVPAGLAFGRLGNFINAELWGKTTTLPWGMVFPHAGSLPRHPTQLYEAALEGVALFALLWWFSGRARPTMAVSGLFLLGYGAARFAVEFVRVPDEHLGYLALEWLTMGQVLSAPMVLAGAGLLIFAYVREDSPGGAREAAVEGAKKRARPRRR